MKPILLASQSNSGSTWFADCIAAANPHLKYFPKEFFNPILNHRHHARLAADVGCELANCVGNLARSLSQGQVNRLVRDTWGQETYTFTKENYLVWNLEKFARHFQVIGLFRDIDYCFPPARIRVMQWYDNWFWSIQANGAIPSSVRKYLLRHGVNAHRRAVLGWVMVRMRLKSQLARVGAPFIRYEELLHGGYDQVFKALAHLPEEIDVSGVAHHIIATRRKPLELPVEQIREWDEAFNFLNSIPPEFWQQMSAALVQP